MILPPWPLLDQNMAEESKSAPDALVCREIPGEFLLVPEAPGIRRRKFRVDTLPTAVVFSPLMFV
jgi:hypothetical protein